MNRVLRPSATVWPRRRAPDLVALNPDVVAPSERYCCTADIIRPVGLESQERSRPAPAWNSRSRSRREPHSRAERHAGARAAQDVRHRSYPNSGIADRETIQNDPSGQWARLGPNSG
jgi:hypothetical protein